MPARRLQKSGYRGPRRRPLLPLLVLLAALAFLVGLIFQKKPGDVPQPQTPAPNPAQSVGQEEVSDSSRSGIPWNLCVPSEKSPLARAFVPPLTEIDLRGNQLDKRAAPALLEMLAAAEEAGLSPLVCSAYRSWDTQMELFESFVQSLEESGLSPAQARERARTEISYPGTSEHQLGLAVDIVALDYQVLDEGQLETEEQQWLMDHAWEYGFILRYPQDKSEITGVIFEPWHYRYVGREAAQAIFEAGLTLEEYLELEP